MDAYVLKNGLTKDQALTIVASCQLMTGAGAESRLSFVDLLRSRNEANELGKELRVDRNTATCFRNGIMGALATQGRTDAQVDLLLSVASILGIRSWIEFQKVEECKTPFDIPPATPFDGAPA